MQDFRQIKVWQKAHELTLEVYRITQNFPADERFGLTSQMGRSASSIPTNIAEGTGRGSDADFARFLQISNGSSSELEYQLILSNDLGYVQEADFRTLLSSVTEVKRMLIAFIKRLRAKSQKLKTKS